MDILNKRWANGIGISAWRLVSGRLVRSSSGWEECVLGYGRHLEMMGGDGETANRAVCLCILHRAIVYNDEMSNDKLDLVQTNDSS